MDFGLKNRLLVMLDDDATAFDVAAKFVTSEEKMTVFERQYYKHSQGTTAERAATAVEVATVLWAQCYETGV